MKLVEKETLKATPEQVWEIIGDPGNIPAWNHKCVWAESPKHLTVGEKFAIRYSMNGKSETDALGEILEIETSKLLHIIYHYADDGVGMGAVYEKMTLEPKGGGQVLVTHTVDYSKTTLPWFVKLIIVFLGKFGKKAGDGPLDGIRALID